MKGVDGNVREFKRNDHDENRIFCVDVDNEKRWLLTHVFQKGGPKKEQSRAAERAQKIANEQLERERIAIREDTT